MVRPTLLIACAALLGCGGHDSLSPEPPVKPGMGTPPVEDAGVSTPEASSTEDVTQPPPDATPEAAIPIYDGAAPETGAPTTKSCKNAGGVLCTTARWELCPAGFEPVAESDGHLNCAGPNDGWCCQPAPVTSCTMSGAANCIVNACSDCFAPAPDKSLTCEQGRACCVDMCN